MVAIDISTSMLKDSLAYWLSFWLSGTSLNQFAGIYPFQNVLVVLGSKFLWPLLSGIYVILKKHKCQKNNT